MDPNKTLADLIDWAEENADTDETAQLLLDLDSWLAKGGFLPDRWKSPVDAKAYNWAKDHEINHQLAQASRAQVRQALTEINQSLYEAEAALRDVKLHLNLDFPGSDVAGLCACGSNLSHAECVLKGHPR